MRPSRSFLLLLIFLLCFTGLHYLVPDGRLFPSINDFIPADLLHGSKAQPYEIIAEGTAFKPLVYDSIALNDPIPVDSVTTDSLYRMKDILKNFMDTLEHSNRQVRILYYGDSQIEGDRMSSYLREKLRQYSGGDGPGLFLPVMPVMYTRNLWVRSSSNWVKYNYLSYRNGEISHRRFGPFMSVCRYLPEKTISELPVTAYVRIRPSGTADSASSVYDVLRIFYRNNEGSVAIKVSAADRLILADSLRQGNGIVELSCETGDADELLVELSGNVSPDIYGMSIESRNGLIVDNIPQRGSAGLEFTMVDKANLAACYKMLSPDLFILQYGINVVRNVSDDYSYYTKGLSRQLELIREISPGTPVIILGLTDMAEKNADSVRSYDNIPLIIQAQKKAASDAGAYFFDSWKAMGGKASVLRWSERIPPLAQKDLVHLTYDGADTLSKIMIRSLFSRENVADERNKPEVNKVLATTEPVVIKQMDSARPESKLKLLFDSVLKYDPLKTFVFTAPAFWIFLLFVLAGYSLIYKKLFLRNFYLFIVSMFFYYKSGGLFLFLLVFVIVVDYLCGILLGSSDKKTSRKFYILISIISNIGILSYFKYSAFIVTSINDLFGTSFVVYDYLAGFSNDFFGTAFRTGSIILPVGISFFTFQSLSYTIDVYRRKIEPVKNIIDFAFYVSFFPQLVAGPIVRASEFIPQLYSKYHLDKREFSHALFLIANGLVKKIIISDFIAVNFVDRIFDTPSVFSGFENLMAVYGYGLQIYCDFSGYTDIAIGLGLILGFRLPVNFNSPYKATGLSDFWKRWHISLSRWLKDYLYIPLGGNRKGRIRTHINLLLTMLLGGLWHGADLKFIVWGFLHGAGLVVEKIWTGLFGSNPKHGFFSRAVSVFLTFNFVSFCWIFFRANDLESVKIMLHQIISNFSPGAWTEVLYAYKSVLALIAGGYLVHLLPESIKESWRGIFIKIPVVTQMAALLIIAVILYSMRSTEILPFIYFRF
jgi:D-alanyl-lipoteichoic acid acyltransferase DltB (MBOAT superfamily)/lysophospholipase L1-like esterase